MEKLLFHFFRYCEVYMFGSAIMISLFLFLLLFYELKKYPHLTLEIHNEEEPKDK